jgi:hypothetical protein
MSVPTRTTLRHIPDNGILHNHRHENLKSYMVWELVSLEMLHPQKAYSSMAFSMGEKM